MKQFKFEKGPSLLLQITVATHMVSKVAIEHSLGTGLQWSLTSKNTLLEEEIYHWLESYINGITLPANFLSLCHLPPFTQKVLKKVQEIPFGKTAVYEEIAAMVDVPKGARAVGNSCGQNPHLLFIPCHRIIRKDRKIGNYASGSSIKKSLLAFEAE